jgi:hypothetical protein
MRLALKFKSQADFDDRVYKKPFWLEADTCGQVNRDSLHKRAGNWSAAWPLAQRLGRLYQMVSSRWQCLAVDRIPRAWENADRRAGQRCTHPVPRHHGAGSNARALIADTVAVAGSNTRPSRGRCTGVKVRHDAGRECVGLDQGSLEQSSREPRARRHAGNRYWHRRRRRFRVRPWRPARWVWEQHERQQSRSCQQR